MKLIIFSGLPGTGKSSLAEDLGKRLSIPVFAKDWLEAALLRSELMPSSPNKPLGSAGYELLTTLAERQLMLNQSVILDSVASTQSIRDTWEALAKRYHARWYVIECICSEASVHRAKLASRARNIPGWHELEWEDIEKVKEYYSPWIGDHLVVDMVNLYDENLVNVITYCDCE